jgi:hypothetical protein
MMVIHALRGIRWMGCLPPSGERGRGEREREIEREREKKIRIGLG